jgi:hypothetical protein
MRQPSFWSLALAEIADPDYTHVSVDVLPAHATADPAAWARSLFSPAALPPWLARVVSLRDLLGRRDSATCRAASVRRVEGDEALLAFDARRFDVRIGVGVDEDQALVRVVAALRFKGAGARALSLPIRIALPFVLRGMIGRCRRELSGMTR